MNAPITSPRHLGRYRLLRLLGEGGMGVVYLAEDTRLGRQVAVKVPHLSGENCPILRARLLREARAAAAIDHPNVCPIYDIGEFEGVTYLVMPFVAGTPLSATIGPDCPWAPAKALALIHMAALAVEAAHARKVIHRDLKPANILVREGGEPVVMDFGLARLTENLTVTLTRRGALGTPAYMAPEQMEDARTVGPAADVYALGVILYELLTGERPFEGPLPVLCGQVLYAVPEPPSARRPELEPWLDAVCLKALAKKPEERYPSMTAFAEALKPPPASAPRKPAPSVCVPALRIHPVADMELEQGESKALEVQVTRQHCAGPVELWLEGRDPGVALGRGLISAEKDHALVRFRAGGRSTPGPRTIRLHARSAQVRAEMPVQVTIGKRLLPGKTVNSLGMTFLLIPAGNFWVGPPEEQSRWGEEMGREVEIARPFYVSVCEVTKEQYEQVMSLSRNGFSAGGERKAKGMNQWSLQRDTISWADAVRFCENLSAMQEEKKRARSYRMPTEEEWECACQDDSAASKPFHFWDSLSKQALIGWRYSSNGAAETDYLRRTSEIGSTPGIVRVDSQHREGRQKSVIVKDIAGLAAAEEGRVLRGGSWLPVGWYCNSAYRGREGAGHGVYAGFRIVCAV